MKRVLLEPVRMRLEGQCLRVTNHDRVRDLRNRYRARAARALRPSSGAASSFPTCVCGSCAWEFTFGASRAGRSRMESGRRRAPASIAGCAVSLLAGCGRATGAARDAVAPVCHAYPVEPADAKLTPSAGLSHARNADGARGVRTFCAISRRCRSQVPQQPPQISMCG